MTIFAPQLFFVYLKISKQISKISKQISKILKISKIPKQISKISKIPKNQKSQKSFEKSQKSQMSQKIFKDKSFLTIFARVFALRFLLFIISVCLILIISDQSQHDNMTKINDVIDNSKYKLYFTMICYCSTNLQY